jgi:quinol monooxygenase YgiN
MRASNLSNRSSVCQRIAPGRLALRKAAAAKNSSEGLPPCFIPTIRLPMPDFRVLRNMEEHMPEPIDVVASFTPKHDQHQAVEHILRGMAVASRKEPGCLRYDLYRTAESPALFVLEESYRDAAALEAHRATDHYRAFRPRIADLLSQPIQVQVLHRLDVVGD